MRKNIGDIELANISIATDGEWEKNGDSINLDERIEGFKIVESSLLADILSNEVSLVAINGAVRMGLKAVHPLTTENMHIGVRKNELSCSIAM